MDGIGLWAFEGGAGAFLEGMKACVEGSDSSEVHEGDKAHEFAVCGPTTPIVRGSGMPILRLRWFGEPELAVLGREKYCGGVKGLIGRGVGMWGETSDTRSYFRLETAGGSRESQV
jgi:hypothetical protein